MRRNTIFVAAALGTLTTLPACNPYQNFSGEYFAGPVDATAFQAPYLGDLPGPKEQSGGTIAPFGASVNGASTFYYLFPLPGAQAGLDNPLMVDDIGPPGAYVFDPTATSAFPSPSRCKSPENYVYDQRTENYRHDEQGVIFTKLPSAADYVPIVEEIPVTSNGVACQDPKSAAALKNKRQDLTVGNPNGKFLAFALIDPGADVLPNLANGLGPIHTGFYNHYLTVFLDGGYIPTVDVPEMPGPTPDDDPIPAHTDFVTQRLFFPSSIPVTETDDMGMDVTVAGEGALGAGFDILEAARGDAAYSPICEVVVYDPELDADGIPVPKTSVADLTQAETDSATPTGELIYCFQVF